MRRLTASALLCCVVACERDHHEPPPPPPPAPSPPHDIVIALDMSKSMEDTDLTPSRIEAAKQVLREFVASDKHDHFGIVIYGQRVKRVAAITNDVAAIDASLGKLQIGDVAELGTAMGDGVANAVDALGGSPKQRKVVVLVGDGDNNWVIRFDPAQAEVLAKQAGVRVFTFLVGGEPGKGAFFPDADPAEFTSLAANTGGRFYRERDTASLERDLHALAVELAAP